MQTQQLHGLVAVEGEILHAELEELSRRPHPREVQRRVGARTHRELRARRQSALQEGDDLPRPGGPEQVSVVQHEHEGTRGRQRLRQQRQDALPQRRDGEQERAFHGFVDGRHRRERAAQVREQDDGVAVGLVHLHPGGRPGVLVHPLAKRRRLARAGRRADDDERVRAAREQAEHAPPTDDARMCRRRRELGEPRTGDRRRVLHPHPFPQVLLRPKCTSGRVAQSPVGGATAPQPGGGPARAFLRSSGSTPRRGRRPEPGRARRRRSARRVGCPGASRRSDRSPSRTPVARALSRLVTAAYPSAPCTRPLRTEVEIHAALLLAARLGASPPSVLRRIYGGRRTPASPSRG